MIPLRVTVTNVMGARHISLPLSSKPLLVTGRNAAGKSSTAAAVRAVLTHDANPLGLIPKQRKAYINDDAQFAEASLTSGGQEMVRWIAGDGEMKVFAEAPPPESKFAAGMVNFVHLKSQKDRDMAWEELLLPPAEQLHDELVAELEAAIENPKVLEDVLDELRLENWAHVESIYEKAVQAAKRKWSDHTGEHWGDKKIEGWKAPNWHIELTGITVSDAREELRLEREQLAMLEGQREGAALSGESLTEAESAAERVPTLKEDLRASEERLSEVESRQAVIRGRIQQIKTRGVKARAEFDSLKGREPKADNARACPECGTLLVAGEDGVLVKHTAQEEFAKAYRLWEKRMTEQKEALEECRTMLKQAEDDLAPVEEAFAKAIDDRSQRTLAVNQAEALARLWAERENVTENLPALIAKQREIVEDRDQDLQTLEVQHKSDAILHEYRQAQAILDCVGPKGVRGRALRESLGGIVGALNAISEVTDWPKVIIERGFAITCGDRPAVLCSASEQWRAQVMLQCAIAMEKKSSHVVVDVADVLDPVGASQLGLLGDWLSENYGIGMLVFATETISRPPEWARVHIVEGAEENAESKG